MIFRKVTDLIGNTPVIQLPLAQSESRLYIKVEKTTRGSMKDRMARNMIVAALKSGRIQPCGQLLNHRQEIRGSARPLRLSNLGLNLLQWWTTMPLRIKLPSCELWEQIFVTLRVITAKMKSRLWNDSVWRLKLRVKYPAQCS